MSARAATATKFGALYHRDYRRYFFLALVGLTAESVEHVCSYWVIFETFHSPTLGGFAVFGSNVPMKRPGQPEEVAKAIYFLCTDASSYVTGAELHINGGQHV